MSRRFAAVDLGASSGRVMLADLTDGLSLTEAHRFPNGPVRVAGRLYWDVLGLYREILAGLRDLRDGFLHRRPRRRVRRHGPGPGHPPRPRPHRPAHAPAPPPVHTHPEHRPVAVRMTTGRQEVALMGDPSRR
ncbi:hypothetical protein AB0J43_46625 [Nonomuraea fuscirosea]